MIMEHEWLNKENILNQLDKLDVDTRRYKTVISFIFKPLIVDLMKLIDSNYASELGPPAYPRLQLLAILAFAEIRGEDDPDKICQLCKTDDIFKILTPTRKPTRNTLNSLFNWQDETIFLSIFLLTVSMLNDYDFPPKDKKHYLDSTDALVNASVNYLITEEEIEALELMKKWNLIHNSTPKKIRQSKIMVECKLRQYKNNPEITKLIGIILKRIKLYNTTVYSKLDEFKEALVDANKNYVSINFPEAVKIHTKRGKWDMGLNLQEVLTSNSLVLTGLLQRKPNDQGALKDIEQELFKNYLLLKKIQKEYGERRNYRELEKIFNESKIHCDSGYDGEENNITVVNLINNIHHTTQKTSKTNKQQIKKETQNNQQQEKEKEKENTKK